MSERAVHTVNALVAAARTSEVAFATLLRSEDELSLASTLEMLSSLPAGSEVLAARLKAVASHPSEQVRAVGWAHRVVAAPRRSRKRVCREAAAALGSRGACALAVALADRGEEEVAAEVLDHLLRRDDHEWEPLLSLLEQARLEWVSLPPLVAAIASCEVSAREAAGVHLRVQEQVQWRGVGEVLVLAAPSLERWLPQLSEAEQVVATRREVTDRLARTALTGEEWELDAQVAQQLGDPALRDLVAGQEVSLETLAGEALTQSALVVLTEVCEAAGEGLATSPQVSAAVAALTALLQRGEVSATTSALREQGSEVGRLTQLCESARASTWSPGVVSPQAVQLLAGEALTDLSRIEERVSVVAAQVLAAAAGGSGWEAGIAELARLAGAVHDRARTSGGVSEETEETGRAVASVLVETRIPWTDLEDLVGHCVLARLDDAAGTLAASSAGDERFTELACAVPYICDVPDIRGREHPAAVAREILTRLCDPTWEVTGMTRSDTRSDEEARTRWRTVASGVAASVLTLTPSEVGALPWQLQAHNQTAEAIGDFLVARLGDDPGLWEVLAGISDTHTGTVSEICETVIACTEDRVEEQAAAARAQ